MRTRPWTALTCAALVALPLLGRAEGLTETLEARRWAFLPERAAAALKAAYPRASLWSVDASGQDEWQLFAVELGLGQRAVDVKLTADGLAVETQTDLRRAELPRPVRETLVRAAAGVPIERVWKTEVLRERNDAGALVALAKPHVRYEASVGQRGERRYVRMAADGTLVPQEEGVGAQAAGHEVDRASLPPATVAALQSRYPDAKILTVFYDRRSLRGLGSYKVEADRAGLELEVEVTADGTIVETDMELARQEVPPPVADQAASASAGGRVHKVKRKELLARLEGQRLVRLEPPLLFYEARYVLKGQRRFFVEIAPDGTLLNRGHDAGKRRGGLPEAAVAAVQAAVPDGELGGSHITRARGGVEILYFGLSQSDHRQVQVRVTPDGTIVEIDRPATAADLPRLVTAALGRAAPGAKVERLRQRELRARLADGKVVRIDPPQTVYEARILQDERQGMMEFAPDGRLLK